MYPDHKVAIYDECARLRAENARLQKTIDSIAALITVQRNIKLRAEAISPNSDAFSGPFPEE